MNFLQLLFCKSDLSLKEQAIIEKSSVAKEPLPQELPKQLHKHFLNALHGFSQFASICYFFGSLGWRANPEAIFLVMSDPSMNKL
jgi:hypothetical protein